MKGRDLFPSPGASPRPPHSPLSKGECGGGGREGQHKNIRGQFHWVRSAAFITRLHEHNIHDKAMLSPRGAAFITRHCLHHKGPCPKVSLHICPKSVLR